ncbi:aminoglycoside phosphotransferase family protein [Salinigranum marinum]|uniref:phosphotransferase family protein n=1 Tax=Salinigranum marinum TaxID=1515595 RepID=UPI002989E14B|nr:aminoglycoside phosphotransferase family protein [Salinigranum marinum]
MNVPDAVAAVVAREFPDSEVHAVERLAGGCKDTYRVELCDRAVVVAFPREAWYARRFALEPALMRLVRRETTVPVPRVLASDASGRVGRSYHVTTAIDAADLDGRFASLSRETQVALIEAAGRALAELHDEVRFDAVGPLVAADTDRGVAVDPRPSWPAFLEELVDTWVGELDGSRFADLTATFEGVLTPASFPSLDPAPVCLHFDYAPGNLLARGGDLVGVVDWGFAVAGHAEYDLFEFEKNFLLGQFDSPAVRDELRPHVYAGYRDVRGFEPGWERRRAFYRVAYKLASMRSFHRWAGGQSDRARAALAARLRAELEADLERLRRYE